MRSARDRALRVTEEQDLVREDDDRFGRRRGEARAAGGAKGRDREGRPYRRVEARHRAAVSLLGADLQRPPHPPTICTIRARSRGYPALVINGGLTALMLVEAARPTLAGTIAGCDARAMAPLFMARPTVLLNSRAVGDTVETWRRAPKRRALPRQHLRQQEVTRDCRYEWWAACRNTRR